MATPHAGGVAAMIKLKNPSFSALLLRIGWFDATRFWQAIRESPLGLECVTAPDLERAEAIAVAWADQEFDLVDCTSFAVMERVGCSRVASFDRDFAVYRYGAQQNRAFEVIG